MILNKGIDIMEGSLSLVRRIASSSSFVTSYVSSQVLSSIMFVAFRFTKSNFIPILGT